MSMEHKIRTVSYIKNISLWSACQLQVYFVWYSVKQFPALLKHKKILHFLQKTRLWPILHNLNFLLSTWNSGQWVHYQIEYQRLVQVRKERVLQHQALKIYVFGGRPTWFTTVPALISADAIWQANLSKLVCLFLGISVFEQYLR